MTFTRRLAIAAVVLISLQLAAYVLIRNGRVGAAVAGSFAPTVPLGNPEVVGVIDAHHLSDGPIIALTLSGDTAFLLQNHTWSQVVGSEGAGPFGTATRGAQGWIASAAAIAVDDSSVVILDRVQRALHMFRRNGTWVHTRKLELTIDGREFLPERFAIGNDNDVFLTGVFYGRQYDWALLRVSNDKPVARMHSVAGGLFDFLLPVVGINGEPWAIHAASYSFLRMNNGSNATPVFTRTNPPRVAIPDSLRRSVAVYSTQLGPGNEPPTHLPVVVDAIFRSDSSLLVALSAADDSVFVEEIDSRGSPLRTLARSPLPMPVALTRGAVYALREEANTTVVERRSIKN